MKSLISLALLMLSFLTFSCSVGVQNACDDQSSNFITIDDEQLNDDSIYETPVTHDMLNSAGGTSLISGKIIISRKNLILQMDSKIEIQQGLVIDKLTIPVLSIKNFKVSRSGDAFSFELGPTKMKFRCLNSREVASVICRLQKRGD